MRVRLAAFLAALFLMAATPGWAQLNLSGGVKAGVNFANLSFDPEEGCCDYIPGFVGGLFISAPMTDSVAIQPEFLYSMKGANSGPNGGDVDFNFNYFEVPILVRADFTTAGNTRPFVVIGPAVGFNLSAKLKAEGQEEDIKDDVESVDFSLALGGGIQFGRASFEGRYTHGLRDIDKDPDSKARTRAFSVLVGYQF